MTQPELQPGIYYHIYNRGNNGETIFKETRNYQYFLKLYGKYIAPITDTYAYCLLGNHFHFLIRVKEYGSFKEPYSSIHQPFATFFGTYTKAINKAYARTGSLFEGRFKRKQVSDDRYFSHLVAYIHRNPQRHGFVDDFRNWPYSSFQTLCSKKSTFLARDETLAWFDGDANFLDFHQMDVDIGESKALLDNDF